MQRFMKTVVTQEFDGALFRDARIQAGITQADICRRAGVSSSYLHRLESCNEGGKGNRIGKIVEAFEAIEREKALEK